MLPKGLDYKIFNKPSKTDLRPKEDNFLPLQTDIGTGVKLPNFGNKNI